MENTPDEDGWVTVTRHGRNKGVPRTEAQEAKITKKEKRKRKQKVMVGLIISACRWTSTYFTRNFPPPSHRVQYKSME